MIEIDKKLVINLDDKGRKVSRVYSTLKLEEDDIKEGKVYISSILDIEIVKKPWWRYFSD